MKGNGVLFFNSKDNANTSILLTNLAGSLLQKLPPPESEFGIKTAAEYYSQVQNECEDFVLHNVEVTTADKILRNLDVAKVCRIDQISPKFLKDCVPALAIHLANVMNLLMKQIYLAFSFKIKITKITSLFKRGIKTEDRKYTTISLMALISKVLEK